MSSLLDSLTKVKESLVATDQSLSVDSLVEELAATLMNELDSRISLRILMNPISNPTEMAGRETSRFLCEKLAEIVVLFNGR